MDSVLPYLDFIRYLPPAFEGQHVALAFNVDGAERVVVVPRKVFRDFALLCEAVREQVGISAPNPAFEATPEELAVAWEKVADDELITNAQAN